MIWLVIGFDFNHMEKMMIWLGIWLEEGVIGQEKSDLIGDCEQLWKEKIQSLK